MKAILLSGGIDSAALAYWQKPDVAYNINYGQKAAQAERTASTAIAKELGLRIEFLDIDCSILGSGDLSNQQALEIAPVSEWWPYRNQLLITLACSKAVALQVSEIMIGAVRTDGRHRDGTKGFFERLNDLVSYQEGHIVIKAPAINLSTLELIEISKVPSSILGWTHSCHKSNRPCGDCNGCYKHLETKTFINH